MARYGYSVVPDGEGYIARHLTDSADVSHIGTLDALVDLADFVMQKKIPKNKCFPQQLPKKRFTLLDRVIGWCYQPHRREMPNTSQAVYVDTLAMKPLDKSFPSWDALSHDIYREVLLCFSTRNPLPIMKNNWWCIAVD